jgi:hypothetical protein
VLETLFQASAMFVKSGRWDLEAQRTSLLKKTFFFIFLQYSASKIDLILCNEAESLLCGCEATQNMGAYINKI